MATKKRLEDCKTEAEEVRWFEDNQDLLLKKFKQAAAKGKLIPVEQVVDLSAKRPGSKKVMIRLPLDDLERARRVAARKGLGYQTLVKMLLHEGLDREETMAGAAPAPRRRAR